MLQKQPVVLNHMTKLQIKQWNNIPTVTIATKNKQEIIFKN